MFNYFEVKEAVNKSFKLFLFIAVSFFLYATFNGWEYFTSIVLLSITVLDTLLDSPIEKSYKNSFYIATFTFAVILFDLYGIIFIDLLGLNALGLVIVSSALPCMLVIRTFYLSSKQLETWETVIKN